MASPIVERPSLAGSCGYPGKMTTETKTGITSSLVLLLAWVGCAASPDTPSREGAEAHSTLSTTVTTADPRLGAWERLPHADDDDSSGSGAVIEISETHLTWASATGIDHIDPIVERTAHEIVASGRGRRERLVTHVGDADLLTLTWTPTATPFEPKPERREWRYRRLDVVPAALDRSSLSLGDDALTEEDVRTLQDEFVARRDRDQEVREVFANGGKPSDEDMAKMKAVDLENTAWLIELIGRIGWIDAERFGVEAAQAAFLLVQHSGNLRLMQTALPLIKQDVDAERLHGSPYALLHDRTALNQGQRQRYGSQLNWGPDGLFVAPLENPDTVDERRASLGMQPLADYLGFFADQQTPDENGTMPPIPIHEDF